MTGKVLYILRFQPTDIGNGGNHRSYQIMHDLVQTVGQENVITYEPEIKFSYDASNHSNPNGLMRLIGKVKPRLSLFLKYLKSTGSPYKLLPHVLAQTQNQEPFGRVGIKEYEEFLGRIPQPTLCICENPGFASLTQINLQRGIPTIYCPHNIEAFDMYGLDLKQEWSQYAVIANFVKEFKLMAQCDERLFISRVEAGLGSGLGLTARYYPYLPVGKIRQRMQEIRNSRSNKTQSGLFLMVGTAAHQSTGESFRWFINHVVSNGIPNSAKVVVCGENTEKLLPNGVTVPGLELRGWVKQEELDWLMQHAQAVLVPQRSGFGALTRLSELSCAGIPVIVSEHATLGMDVPPGVISTPDNWDDWMVRIIDILQGKYKPDIRSYEEWESRQVRPLGKIVRNYMI